ncbi:MAG: hypothetical protein HY731_13770 [Candidatus Tectomicrobia bacterium]|nr:hypothetical protein [Candidatus Tectomicrobia bacterium]
MKPAQIDPDPRMAQAEFHIGYIWVALVVALFAGFAIGAHLTFVISYGFPLGKGFYSFIQAHGHVQLVGWAGLFIIGVSLHFIPRLASVPVSQPQGIRWVLWLMATGLFLRSVGHSVVPYLTESSLFVPFNWVVASSGFIEWCAVLLYLSLLIGTLRRVGDITRRPALAPVRPYFGMMLAGWIVYATLNLLLLIHMALSQNVVVNQAWNEFAIQVFIGLVLLPVAFAFSLRMFPLYFRLASLDWPVRGTAYAYLFSFCLQVVPTSPLILGLAPQAFFYLSSLGMLLKGGVILWFVWKLDLLTHLREPWTAHRPVQPGPERRPTRPNMPDYGEFGRFERLVYAAYIWLVLGASFDLVRGAADLLGSPLPISNDAVRHIYLLGFVTHLIFGMSVRMIPGFLKKKQVASTQLVDATFWLGNTATVCRVLPLMLPSVVLETIPLSMMITQTAFAFSGITGLIAVFCLTKNLWKTV